MGQAMYNNMNKHKINKVISLLKVRVEITTSGAHGDKDLLPKFLLLREVRLRLERVRSTMLTRSQRGPPYFSSRSYQCKCRDSTIRTLEGGHRTRTNGNPWGRSPNPYKCSGQSPQPNWRSHSVPKLSTTIIELRNNKPLGANA